jgi:SAM-dependent methyltransferase
MSTSHSVPVRPTDGSAATLFADSWSIYVRILEHNYMFHREIYRNLRDYLQTHFGERTFSVLDLGCGNAQHFVGALAGLPVTGYTGYDLSAAALDEAARNLAALAVPTALKQGDLLDALKQESKTFDLIFTSFAVHHLPSEDKAEFFRRAVSRCSADGVLVMIDVMRDEDQDRDTYLDAYASLMAGSWTALPREALAQIESHIRENDQPESRLRLKQMAAAAGFGEAIDLPEYSVHRTLVWPAPGLRG